MRRSNEHDDQLGELTERLGIFRRRYGSRIALDGLAGIERAIATRRRRIAECEQHIADLEKRRADDVGEMSRLTEAYEVMLREKLADLEDQYPEGWSPDTIAGYRLWGIDRDVVRGFWEPWTSPSFLAKCEAGSIEEVPHTDDRCGHPPCGIYATRDVATLDPSVFRSSDGVVVGRVALFGKVVEHEHGYRAAAATVVAAAARFDDRMLMVTDEGLMEELFASPTLLILRDGFETREAHHDITSLCEFVRMREGD